jgi:hypothetical protein
VELREYLVALVDEWNAAADDPNSTVEVMAGDIYAECADALEFLLLSDCLGVLP